MAMKTILDWDWDNYKIKYNFMVIKNKMDNSLQDYVQRAILSDYLTFY